MDTFSHALWGKGLFGYRKYRWYSILFGVIPDLSSFGVFSLYNLLINPAPFKFGKPDKNDIPEWVDILYNISHSLVIAFLFIAIVYCLKKDLCFPMLAWPFHIFLDFFTHADDYYETPILEPLSNYRFEGISWTNPYIWFGNVLCIILVFVYRRKKTTPKIT
tara:strand:+ start:646 stop:1131 length:486 start_codon:yes stop_codon:yes gene_type:complete